MHVGHLIQKHIAWPNVHLRIYLLQPSRFIRPRRKRFVRSNPSYFPMQSRYRAMTLTNGGVPPRRIYRNYLMLRERKPVICIIGCHYRRTIMVVLIFVHREIILRGRHADSTVVVASCSVDSSLTCDVHWL
jgi:hypothetical protein